MGKIEDRIIKQRKESADRIKQLYPAECLKQETLRCHFCRHYTYKSPESKVYDCEFDLAPITSALLPCPYLDRDLQRGT